LAIIYYKERFINNKNAIKQILFGGLRILSTNYTIGKVLI